MRLHDLQPAPGSRQPRTRVGRGIAAGKGKTAGRGTKGQKARAGGSIAPWFEGGQTPIQIRIPKLRGFRNRFRVAYEVVNVGRLEAAAEEGRFAEAQAALAQADEAAVARRGKRSDAPLTVTADLLHASGLIGSLKRPLKVLGGGELTRPFFVVADAFSATARSKIEAAGGTAQLLVPPSGPLEALTVSEPAAPAPAEAAPQAEPAAPAAKAKAAPASRKPAKPAAAPPAPAGKPAPAAKAPRRPRVEPAPAEE
ncbi:MAG TPA: 50S ribosomal protein L15 [Candidatus Sulfotelmatobacter sp.]|nr:50S ribosomal protein L15 [Candidatus Sulfotelmatobacter sp.]